MACDEILEAPLLDLAPLEQKLEGLAGKYRTARPFPHAVFDDLLLVGGETAEDFPPPDWHGWRSLSDTYQFQKFFCQDSTIIPPPFSTLISELSQPRFLRILEAITGIERLLPDPYLTGGGLHLSGPGGVLAPHTDFHIYSQLALFRRVNVLVYLNPEWSASDGGCLELWSDDEGTERQTIVPIWGRVVIFSTDDSSVHGFPTPISEGKWRRSLATYYYTAEPAASFSGDSTTFWRTHGDQTGVRRLRLSAYRALLSLSRAFSISAQLVNPNQGPRSWWHDRKQRGLGKP